MRGKNIIYGENTGFETTVTGRLTIVDSLSNIKYVCSGDITYIPRTAFGADSLLPIYRAIKLGAIGIIREGGGRTDHGSVAAKEMGVPCITLGSSSDLITSYSKKVISIRKNEVLEGAIPKEPIQSPDRYPLTSHKVKINLGFPEVLDKYPALPDVSDGVAFARLEFLLLDILENVHILEYIKRNGKDELARRIADSLEPAVKAFHNVGKPFWIRTDDFSPEHLISMEHGQEYETEEANPAVGWRGIRRSIDQPEIVRPQFQALKILMDRGYSNIGMFPPMVTHVSEYRQWLELAREAGLTNITKGLTVETPRAAYTINEFIGLIDFALFGTNDLTQFLLTIDRGNVRLASRFDETDPIVISVMNKVIESCNRADVETTIGGQAGSSIRLLKNLPSITGTSVNPDPYVISDVRNFYSQIENN